MTFADFQQLCNQAVSTQQPMSLPCPIVVGDEANIRSTLGDTLFHWVIVFKTTLGNAQMQAIYHSVRFNFDQPNNQTVIHPLTTGT